MFEKIKEIPIIQGHCYMLKTSNSTKTVCGCIVLITNNYCKWINMDTKEIHWTEKTQSGTLNGIRVHEDVTDFFIEPDERLGVSADREILNNIKMKLAEYLAGRETAEPTLTLILAEIANMQED